MAQDSGRVGFPVTCPPIHYFLILRLLQCEAEPGAASLPVCWGHGDMVASGTQWPCDGGTVSCGRASCPCCATSWGCQRAALCHPLSPQDGSGCPQGPAGGGDMGNTHQRAVMCHHGAGGDSPGLGSPWVIPLSGGTATMLWGPPGLAPWGSKCPQSWGSPHTPKISQAETGGAVVQPQPSVTSRVALCPCLGCCVLRGNDGDPTTPSKLYFHIVFNKSIKVLLFVCLCSWGGWPRVVALGEMGMAGM